MYLVLRRKEYLVHRKKRTRLGGHKNEISNGGCLLNGLWPFTIWSIVKKKKLFDCGHLQFGGL